MALVSKAFGDIITFTRASTATYFDSAGVLQSAAINTPRFDYDPATLAARGFLIEEARTNGIRNNTMQGAVAGTPGTAPTNWTISTPSDGVDANVIGTGTQNGITYIDVQFVGTSGTGGLSVRALFDSNTQIVAANGQTWTGSAWFSLVGGSLTNVTTLALRVRYLSAAGAELTGQNINLVSSLTATPQRIPNTFAATDATTAFVNLGLSIDYVNSSAVDFTLRIGLPQLEQGAFATSVIPTTTTALTRSADVASVNTLSPWFNATEGTLYAEFNCPTAATTQYFASLDLSALTRMSLYNNAGSGYWFVRDGGVTQAGVTNGTITSGATVKVAGAYAINSFNLSTNGGIGTEDTSGSVPSGLTRLSLGSYTASALNPLNGYLRRIVYYPRRLSNAELQSITS